MPSHSVGHLRIRINVYACDNVHVWYSEAWEVAVICPRCATKAHLLETVDTLVEVSF